MIRGMRQAVLLLASIVLVLPAGARAQDPGGREQTGGLARTEGALGRLADEPGSTPERKAAIAYKDGIALRDKAWKLEERAASAEGATARKRARKAQKAYKKAIGRFRAAVAEVPDFHQGWASLGHALRKTGQYQESLEACDEALAINPHYSVAIQYRGETFLALDRIEESKGAYAQLLRLDRQRAAELMAAMRRWLEQRRQDAGGVSRETLDSFADWVEESDEPVA